MLDLAGYTVATALLRDGVTQRYVIVDPDDRLHVASSWLSEMHDRRNSPNTIKSYASKVAAYLSWTAQTADWRSISLPHLSLWRRTVAATPARKTNGAFSLRSDTTVGLWLTPLRSFYEWAERENLLKSDVAARITQIKYFPPGSPAGGEHGARRRVLAEDLKPIIKTEHKHPEWIHSESARQRLEELLLTTRDRFLIDLMYYTGIRAGEALSLFTADLHFGGGSSALNCNKVDPHFHVRINNRTENGARAKGRARTLFVNETLIEGYVDYLIERNAVLGNSDISPHVFVNLYSADKGRAMRYSGVRKLVRRCGGKIGFPLNGPHILRHTFATRLVRGIGCEVQGLDVVQHLLGHASIDSTRVYTHGQEEASKAAIQSLATRTLNLGRNI